MKEPVNLAVASSGESPERMEPHQTGGVTLAERIAELAKQHGSLRAAARALDVDPGYLSRLRAGLKDDPSDTLLRKMDLRRVVLFVRRTTKSSPGEPLRERAGQISNALPGK